MKALAPHRATAHLFSALRRNVSTSRTAQPWSASVSHTKHRPLVLCIIRDRPLVLGCRRRFLTTLAGRADAAVYEAIRRLFTRLSPRTAVNALPHVCVA